jgi:hypothetical protein
VLVSVAVYIYCIIWPYIVTVQDTDCEVDRYFVALVYLVCFVIL